MGVSVGVDLHKGQFTVYWRWAGDPLGRTERLRTNELGYQWLEGQLKRLLEEGQEVRLAVESTGNTRYFKRRVEALGVPVVVINTMKFKVVTESVKKTDRRDAATIAEFLEKDMLPEAKLCSTESEELRRVLKARTVLVRSVVAIKNQVHGLLLSLGIETKRGSLQSQEGRRRVLNVLAEHGLAGQAVEPLLETIDRLEAEVKKLAKILEQKVQADRVVQLLTTIPGAGLITASTIRAYVDDIGRFVSYKQFSVLRGAGSLGAELQRHRTLWQHHQARTLRVAHCAGAGGVGHGAQQADYRRLSAHGALRGDEERKGQREGDHRHGAQAQQDRVVHVAQRCPLRPATDDGPRAP
jgi:transposase